MTLHVKCEKARPTRRPKLGAKIFSNISIFHSSTLQWNTLIVGETRESWATRRVDPALLFSKLATYLTCSSYNKCIISFSSNNCSAMLIHAISFMLPP